MNEAIKVTQVAKDIYVFTDLGSDFSSNATVIITSEGPIIIDVFKDSFQFDSIKCFINDLGFETPAAIIYTHWHSDHTCGNTIFSDCKIIASEYTKRHLESFILNDLERLRVKGIVEKDAMPILPNMTFVNTINLTIGERELELVHCPGHSFDSILVYDKISQTLIAGDNLVGQEVAFFMPPVIPPDEVDAQAEDLFSAFSVIEKFHSKVLVPGHGSIDLPDVILRLNRERYNKLALSNGDFNESRI